MLQQILDMSYVLLAGAPIMMFVNIYAWVAHKENMQFRQTSEPYFKVMDGYMHIFCPVSIKTHIISMLELQMSPFFTDSLHEA